MSVNLELRRKALEATGWTLGTRFWHHPRCSEDIGCVTACGRSTVASLPRVESEPGESEPWFLEWCEKRGYMWEMRTEVTYDDVKWPMFGVSIRDSEDWMNDLYYASGATPSEARTKAVIAASTKSKL